MHSRTDIGEQYQWNFEQKSRFGRLIFWENKILVQVGDICIKKLPTTNPPLMMFICGSKGSNINLCQMIACVGQQTVNGQRYKLL